MRFILFVCTYAFMLQFAACQEANCSGPRSVCTLQQGSLGGITPLNCPDRCCWDPTPNTINCYEPSSTSQRFFTPGGWSYWSTWSGCTGSAVTCTAGTRTRFRYCLIPWWLPNGCRNELNRYQPFQSVREECQHPSCMTTQWATWEQWTTCSTTCSPGSRSRTRECRNGDEILPDSDCSGDATMTSDCNVGLCTGYSVYEIQPGCSSDCSPGVTTQTRTCVGTGNAPASCLINDNAPCNEGSCTQYNEYEFSTCTSTCQPGTHFESRTCAGTGIVPPGCGARDPVPCNTDLCTSYSQWMATVCSSTCSPGTQMEMRFCTGTGCAPAECTFRNQVACNADLCPSFTEYTPFTECSETCGDGTLEEQRVCAQINPNLPEINCVRRFVPCNEGTCEGTDPDIDLLLVLDSTRGLDECFERELDLGARAPFTAASGLLTIQNGFVNFLRQNEFAKGLLSAWRTVGNDRTNVAIQQHSGRCEPPPNFNGIDILSLAQNYDPSIIDNLSYQCEENHPINILFCSSLFQFTTARGDRPDRRNVMIFFITDVRYIVAQSIILTLLETAREMWIEPRGITLFTISTANLDELDQNERDSNITFLQQIACLMEDVSGGCDNFLGHIHEDVSTIISRLRSVL